MLAFTKAGKAVGQPVWGEKWRFQVRSVRLALTLWWGHMGRDWSYALVSPLVHRSVELAQGSEGGKQHLTRLHSTMVNNPDLEFRRECESFLCQ